MNSWRANQTARVGPVAVSGAGLLRLTGPPVVLCLLAQLALMVGGQLLDDVWVHCSFLLVGGSSTSKDEPGGSRLEGVSSGASTGFPPPDRVHFGMRTGM